MKTFRLITAPVVAALLLLVDAQAQQTMPNNMPGMSHGDQQTPTKPGDMHGMQMNNPNEAASSSSFLPQRRRCNRIPHCQSQRRRFVRRRDTGCRQGCGRIPQWGTWGMRSRAERGSMVAGKGALSNRPSFWGASFIWRSRSPVRMRRLQSWRRKSSIIVSRAPSVRPMFKP
jgi:hypothetical protein